MARKQTRQDEAPAQPAPGEWTIERHYRNWRVIDPAGDLVCMTVYKKGAMEVIRRLSA